MAQLMIMLTVEFQGAQTLTTMGQSIAYSTVNFIFKLLQDSIFIFIFIFCHSAQQEKLIDCY